MTDRDLMEFLHSLESVGGSAGEEPCPADEELWAFCCGAISHSRHRAVVSHVADCGRCAARVARALPAGRQWSRNAGAIRQRLRESRARDLGRRRSARRLPLLGLLAPAGVVLGALLIVWFSPRDDWSRLLAAAGRSDLAVARMEWEAARPELFSAGATRASAREDPGGTARPDRENFLPGDVIRFRADPDPGAVRRLKVLREPTTPGEPAVLSLRILRPTATASPGGGWAPGAYTWAFQDSEGLPVAGGTFTVLDASAVKLVARADRELRADPPRLAAVYAVLGLRERRERLVAGLSPEVRARVQRRLGPSDEP